MENIDVKISMEFHGNCCPNVFHGNLWRNFHGIPWRLMSQSSMEFHGGFSQGFYLKQTPLEASDNFRCRDSSNTEQNYQSIVTNK